jgi:hypothetical protein
LFETLFKHTATYIFNSPPLPNSQQYIKYVLVTKPCDTEWIEGERCSCETIYSKADLLAAEDGEQLKMKARRFCRMEGGAFTAILKEGDRGFLADDGD